MHLAETKDTDNTNENCNGISLVWPTNEATESFYLNLSADESLYMQI